MDKQYCKMGGGTKCSGEAEVYRSINQTTEGFVVLCQGHRAGHALMVNGSYVTMEYYDTYIEPALSCVSVVKFARACSKSVAEYFCGREDLNIKALCIDCYHADSTASLSIHEEYSHRIL